MPPSPDEQDDFLLSCRYGDLDDVQQFIAAHGAAAAAEIQDDNGNTPLHMLAGNGHKGLYTPAPPPSAFQANVFSVIEILTYLLPPPPRTLFCPPRAKRLKINPAALGRAQRAPRHHLIDVRNAAGRSPLAEAEMAGWDEGAAWLVGQMKLDEGVKEGAADDAEADVPLDPSQAVEIEIEDANGELAKMTIQS
ncbi:Ankyrin repeat-containing protein P16F5.05c [Mycena kentingensis (nom. inval.)]|nr:Ankyrin repeat-containing protein P16F5.05c [Mycena kentingensis (nom. inval.)]